MSDKAETVTCENCRGKGSVLIHNGVNWNCLKCNGTGVRTTGAVVGALTMPSTPDPVTDDTWTPTITTTQGDAPSAATGNGLRYVYAPGHDSGATVNATGHDGCIRGLDEAKATIAAQAAEIEAMKSVIGRISPENTSLRVAVDRLKGELRTSQEQYGAKVDELKIVRAERDVLRLEVQRLKDLSHESQDLYAAIEAERDELKAELERIRTLGLKTLHEGMEHRQRAESYLRVIEAMERERNSLAAYYLDHHNTLAAQSAAGYRIGEAPAWQAVRDLFVKEADNG